MALRWTTDLAVGIGELDEANQELFRRAERFLEAVRTGGDVAGSLARLHAHAGEAFASEEGLMTESAFAGLVRHQAEHRRFVEDLRQLDADFRKHGAGALAAVAVATWLPRWLAEHVGRTDRELGRFLARKSAA